jgi:hypothetical protein
MASLRLLAEVPSYRGLVMAWVVWGIGSFIATPLYALVLVDRFQAGYAEVGVLQLVGAGSGLLAYLYLGQHLDRRGGFGATPLGMLMVAMVPIAYLVSPSVIVLVVAFVLQSVGTSLIDLGWNMAMIKRVPDEHRLRYQAAHTSITGVRGAVAPFIGSLLIALGLSVGATLVIGAVIALLGTLVMAQALEIRIWPLARAVVGNARRPDRDLAVGHGVVGPRADVVVAARVDVDEVLLARQQRAATDVLGQRRRTALPLEPLHQLAQYPIGDAVALRRKDEVEQDQVRQQDAPVAAEPAQQSLPVEAVATRP